MDQNENHDDDLFEFGDQRQPPAANPPTPETDPVFTNVPPVPAPLPAAGGAQVYGAPPEPTPVYTAPPAAPPARSGGASRVWLIVILVLLLLCCCCLAFLAFMYFYGGDFLLENMSRIAPALAGVV